MFPTDSSPASPTSGPPTADEKQSSAQLKGDSLQERLRQRNLLHYAAYFASVGGLAFVIQTGKVNQIRDAVIVGAIASGCVISRDWYKARLNPSMANDPSALMTLFSEMLHAGRAQANTNAAHLKRVEFIQVDLVEAMRDLNDLLRLDPGEVEQRLRAIQTAHLTSALPSINVPNPLTDNAVNNQVARSPAAKTYIPDSTTLRQSEAIRRPGFNA